MSTERFQSKGNPVEIPTVTRELYAQAREALAREGFTFLVTIRPVSIGQLAGDRATRDFFGYINSSKEMKSNIPPQIEVAIDPNNFKIEGTNNSPTDDQIRKIKEKEALLRGKLPENIRNNITMLNPEHASILAQLDTQHQVRTRMGVLFTNWFGRTDDQKFSGFVACVGREGPARRLRVESWYRTRGYHNVFAVSIAVLPRKLPA